MGEEITEKGNMESAEEKNPVDEKVPEGDKKPEGEKVPDGGKAPESKKEESEEQKENHDVRRMKRLLREKYEYKAKADYLENRIKEIESRGIEKGQPSGKPTLEQFNGDVEKFTDALTDYKIQMLDASRDESPVKSNIGKNWKEREAAIKKEIPDYEEVVYDSEKLEIQESVIEAIFDSEHGPRIHYELSKNPELAEKIRELPDNKAIREIGKIEARIESEKRAKAEKGNKEKPKLPNPIKPEKSGAGAHSDELSAEALFRKFSKGEKILT